MISIEKLLKSTEARLNRAKGIKALMSLQMAECEACGGPFIRKTTKQKTCLGKCRTRLHRERKQE